MKRSQINFNYWERPLLENANSEKRSCKTCFNRSDEKDEDGFYWCYSFEQGSYVKAFDWCRDWFPEEPKEDA